MSLPGERKPKGQSGEAGDPQRKLLAAKARIRDLQEELEESNRGLLALSMELEDRVSQRTKELQKANQELQAVIVELEKSRDEVKSQSLFPNQNPNPVMRVSLEGEILYANRASLPILNFWGSWHSQKLPTEWSELVRSVYLSGENRHLDVKVEDKYFSFTFTPIADSEHVNIYSHEITARKMAEESLQWELGINTALSKLSQELIAKPGDIASVAGVVLRYAKQITNSEHGLVSSIDSLTGENVCHTFTEMMGTDCRISGKGLRVAFGPDENGRFPYLWGHCLNTHQGFFTNNPSEHPESGGLPEGHIPIHCFMTMPVLLGEELLGQIAVANSSRDYDEFDLQALEQLAGLYALALLKEREEEKRVEIERRYRHSIKMEAVGTLAGGIAHDFNNILAAMLGYVNLSLHAMPQDSQFQRNLRQVQKAGDRARNLIKQILAFSRRNDQDMIPMNIVPVVKEVLKLIRATLPSSIEVTQEIDPEPGNVLADPGAVHQVLMNLFSNSAHALGKQGGVLSVKLKKARPGQVAGLGKFQKSENDLLWLAVSDSGCGIDPAVLDRIFEPYFTTKEINEGTGLGLSVVHGIVESLDGAISVESKPGRGTTISIYLPLCQTPGDERTGPQTLSLGRGELILYVDDEEALVDIARQHFPNLGYRVEGFNRPEKALEAFRMNPEAYHLIITDLTMPKMTGDALAAQLKQIRPDIPVIICTGYSESVSEESAKLYGVEAFLLKPLDDLELTDAIRRLLKGENKK